MRVLGRVSSPVSLSLLPGRERKTKFHGAPSFPNQTYGLRILSLPRTAVVFLLVSFCVLGGWLGFLPAWDMQVVSSFFWLSLRVILDLGKVVTFTLSLRMPLGSMGLFDIARNVYCLSWLRPDKIFKRIL